MNRAITFIPPKKKLLPLLAGLVILGAFFAANIIKPRAIETLTDLLFDHYQRTSPRPYDPNTPVRIIDIDNRTLEEYGQWPWPRPLMAKLNDRLSEAGAAVIAYDIVFSEKDRTSPENIMDVLAENPKANSNFDNIRDLKSHDVIFADSMAQTRAVLGFFLTNTPNDQRPLLANKFAWGGTGQKNIIKDFPGAIVPLPSFENAAEGEGFVSFHASGDGIIREAPLVYRMGDDYFRALSIEALRVAMGQGAIVVRMSNGTDELDATTEELTEVAKMRLQDFSFPTLPDGSFRVYFSKPHTNERYISAADILSDSVPISDWQDKIAGHIVFVGTGADGLKDLVSTPIRSREPGVLVHAQIVEQIIGGQFLNRTYVISRVENFILVLAGLLLVLALPYLNATWGAVLSLGVAGSIQMASWIAFKDHLTLLSPIYPLLAILTLYMVMTLISFYLTEMERSRIRGAFSMYLSPTMVKKVSENPALLTLGGEERNMTILFLDIRSFSKISEALEPQEITTFLNIFLTPMTNILQAGKATIDKYIGDAIVAFWNAPLDDEEHEENAARCVLEMNQELARLNAKYEAQTEIKWPDNVSVGIGLNTGVCCVGNLGSEQRFSYSMIGDAANLASRIEGLTKQYKVSVLIGNETTKSLEEFAVLEADRIRVVGRVTPETIHILVGDEEIARSEAFVEHKKVHDGFLEHYRTQEWGKARQLVPQLKDSGEAFGISGYYDVISDRMNIFETQPPSEHWDGVFEATSK